MTRHTAGPRRPRTLVLELIYLVLNFRVFTKPGNTPLQACSGGDDGTRTRDFCLAKAALSQLSYIPICVDASRQWAFLDSNQRPFPYQRNALTD